MGINYSTKDQELAQRLEKEAFQIIAVKRDPADGLKRYTFEESEVEINKFLGPRPKEEETTGESSEGEEATEEEEESKEPEEQKKKKRKKRKRKKS